MKKLFLSFAIVVGTLLGTLAILFWFSPFGQMQRLKDAYYAITVKDGFADYELVKKKPKSWIPLRQISRSAVIAIQISEDWAFHHHDGYDIEQIENALEEGLQEGKWRGASTIPQQVVKNLYLTRDKSLGRKLQEFILAVYLDRVLEKKQIMEIYLNIIEYGPSVYGIGHAAQYYFNKSPAELTPREGAFLAMLLPNPKRYSQSFRQRKLTRYARRSIRAILRKMQMVQFLSAEAFEVAVNSRFAWEKEEDPSVL